MGSLKMKIQAKVYKSRTICDGGSQDKTSLSIARSDLSCQEAKRQREGNERMISSSLERIERDELTFEIGAAETMDCVTNGAKHRVHCLTWRGLARGIVLWLLLILIVPAGAQQSIETGNQTANLAKLNGDSDPYHLQWDGASGLFVRHAAGNLKELRQPLIFLHTDPGPEGYSRYLAWFLARDTEGFTLIWCYLNEGGPDFYCWLYSYPSNQLLNLRLKGNYTFAPPSEPTPGMALTDFAPRAETRYAGPDFQYRDLTRQGGVIAHVPLTPASAMRAPVGVATSVIGGPVLENLRVTPLQEVHVSGGNGWRTEGWRELHALAYDKSGDPYYLILYSNTSSGYVVDLKRAKTYFADFGEKVVFLNAGSVYGPTEDRRTGPPEIRVPRYKRHEISLTSSEAHSNPYTQVLVDCDFKAPDGSRFTVPGFWDGGNHWVVRMAPMRAGDWTWRTRSNDPGLTGQQGAFTCVAESGSKQGFLTINPTDRHSFMLSDGSPFLPVPIVYPIRPMPVSAARKDKTVISTVRFSPEGGAEEGSISLDAGFVQEVDALTALGFNRFVDEYLLESRGSGSAASQPVSLSPLFTADDADRINPAAFQELDRRLNYCNSKGIVPDIGLSRFEKGLADKLSLVQMKRLWRYVLARFSTFDVCWNLFGQEIGSTLPDMAGEIEQDLAQQTRLYDPVKHPLTRVLSGRPEPTDTMSPLPSAAQTGPGENTLQGSYLISPGGMNLWPNPARRLADMAAEARVKQSLTPGAGMPWQSVITFNGGTLQSVSSDLRYNRPIFVYDSSTPPDDEATRHRLWETRMRGGFWAYTAAYGVKARPNDRETVWTAYCAQMFLKTRFWRLEPHHEMLRPVRDLSKGISAAPTQPGSSLLRNTMLPTKADHGIFILADPAWEYLIYFEHGGTAALDLLEATGELSVNWFNPRTGTFRRQEQILGGAHRQFTAPDSEDWVLYLARR